MKTTAKRLAALATAAAVPTVLLAVSVNPASALPAGTAAATPAVAISPTSGPIASTVFNLSGAGATAMNCPGDTAANGFRWRTFITRAQDPAVLVYDNLSGPILPVGSTGFVAPLKNNLGANILQGNTAATTGQVAGIPSMSFNGLGLIDGAYRLGFACTQGTPGQGGVGAGFAANETQKFFETIVTVSGGGANYAFGAVPAAPTAVAASQTSATSANVTFTAPGVATPAVTGYTVTATPTVGAPIVVSGAASPIALTGLTTGTAYSITVVATNATGNSAPSAPAVSFTPGFPPATGVNVSTGATGTAASVSFTPAVGATSYSVSFTSAGNPTVTATGATSPIAVTGLVAGATYTVVVTATYPAGTAVSAPFTYAAPSAQLVNQIVSVVRPAGAIVLTQRCGVNAALPAQTLVDAFPGQPNLPAVASANYSITTPGSLIGGNPTGGTAPFLASTLAGAIDNAVGQFDTYPNPNSPVYPTFCGLNLGTAKFITEGDTLEGQYFAASGALNQVTVLDTRDVDYGWVAKGSMSDFVSGVGGPELSFDGNFLGWTPVLTDRTLALVDGPGSTYTPNAVAGPDVLPGTGIATDAGLGASTGQVLASAQGSQATTNPAPAGNGGLGIATIDARVKLLIPVTKDAGIYTGTLALTVA